MTLVLENLVIEKITSVSNSFDPKKNFGLNEENFKILLNELQEGKENLFEKIFKNHFKECKKYLIFKFGASHDDAHDTTMDTMIRFREMLIAKKLYYGNLYFSFTQMASQAYLKNTKIQDSYEELELGDINLPTEIYEDLSPVAEKALCGCDENCQKIVRFYVYEGLKHEQIARIMGKNVAAIRQDYSRCLKKIRFSDSFCGVSKI
jgi:DNA-directed RNA polymerase specialized sigma24 family protein